MRSAWCFGFLYLVSALPACSFGGDPGATRFRCESTAACPAPQICLQNYCQDSPGPDGALLDDGAQVQADADRANPLLLPWAESTPLPEVRDYNQAHAALVGDKIYVIGGYDWTITDEKNTVYYAQTSADGTVGEWQSAATLPAKRANGDVVAYDGYLYLIGGASGGIAQSTVYVAPISDNGTVGSWTATTPLPAARKAHASFAANGHVYAIGGADTSNGTSAVAYYARVAADGALDAWQQTTALPAARANTASTYLDGFIYLIGGEGPLDTGHRTAYYAPVAADGSIGDWKETSELPAPRHFATAAALGGYIYLFGGIGTGGGQVADVFHAPLQADGGLGDWAPNTSFPALRARHATVLASDFVYVIGGVVDVDTVYFAKRAP